MLHHLLRATGAKSARGFVLEECLDEGDGISIFDWEHYLVDASLDVAEDDHRRSVLVVRIAERSHSGHDLECQNPESPPVHHSVVAAVLYHLRRQVLGGAAERHGPANHELGKTKVAELGIARLGKEDILGLQISEDNAPLVQVREGTGHAPNDEARCLWTVESFRRLMQVIMQITPTEGFKEEVKVLVVFERCVETNCEGAVDHRENIPLIFHVILQLIHRDKSLGESLQGKRLARRRVTLQSYDTVSTHSEDAHPV
mmetsp:Transcript_39015/g.85321  ORF Transcript_39015/g.85321 Transcript_39015/m.85321 type:complete len:258 (-) Transcript_39015:706-1479(-)